MGVSIATAPRKRSKASDLGTPIVAAQCALMIEELRARGLESERALGALAIRYDPASAGRQFLSAAHFDAFLRAAEQISRDPSIGLAAGQRLDFIELHLLGLLLRSSPDLQTALSYFQRFHAASPLALDIDLSVEGDRLVCRRAPQGVAPSRVLSDYFHARATRLLTLLVGAFEPLEVRLMQREPGDLREHRRMLGERLRFRTSEDALFLPLSTLARPAPQPDSVIAGVVAEHLAKLPDLDGSSADLAARVRRSIQEELHHGRATMLEVSERLHVNERTMRRRLSELDTSFQQLLDEVRREVAIHSLNELRCSVSELSVRLGFCGPAAFYRAFRRWTGVSLSEYRAAEGGSGEEDLAAAKLRP